MSIEEVIELAVERGVRRALGQLRPETTEARVTVAQAAALANVSQSTIRTWIDEGLLERFGTPRAIRLRREDVLAVKPRCVPSEKTIEEKVDALLDQPRRR